MDSTQQPGPATQPRTDGKAIGSLICGILSITCFSILAGIPAVILGHLSRSDIRKAMGQLKGQGMALAGLIMGYLSIAMIPVVLIIATIAIPSLLRARQAANESAAVASLREITTAEVNFASSNGGTFGELQELIDARLLDEGFAETENGYTFRVAVMGADFLATAIPASTNTGRYEYFSTSDGVIRYSRQENLAPPGRAGSPVQ